MDRADIAIRLVEERARLGYSQNDFAHKLDVSRETVRRYEVGQSDLSAEFLAKSARLGADVQYILCGVRSANLQSVVSNIGAEHQAAPLVGTAKFQQINHGGTNNQIEQQTINHGTQQHFNGNVKNAIAGNLVVEKVVNRTVVKTDPTDEHIDESQKAILRGLVEDVVTTEGKLKAKPRTYQGVFRAMNAHCGVTQYSLIKKEDFEKARTYLHQWLGRLNSMATAPVKDGDEWRKRRYAYIKVNSKTPETDAQVKAYMKRNFNADSLTELSNDELERVYRYVTGKRSTSKKA
jgi:transcriptional regulator with XRE-family HTH domain